VLFALPLSLAFRRDRFRYGVVFVATFLLSAVGGMLWVGGGENIPLMFSLPDTWALVIGSLSIFWLMNWRHTGTLPSNNTFERDARKSSARPST
jgi:hypothetical protein